MRTTGALLLMMATLAASRTAHAGMIEFTDRSEWEAAVDSYTTIDFTAIAPGTVITTQYSDLGITFTDANDTIYQHPSLFLNDGWGLDGNGNITVVFDEPQSWFAAEFPGLLRYKLYRDDELVYTSSIIFGDVDEFFGLVFPETFDEVFIDGFGSAVIDDLLFGARVPAPPVLALLGLAMIVGGRRSRRD